MCITLSKKINSRQLPIIYDEGEYVYGDVCYVASGYTNDEIKEIYEGYMAPAFEFDEIKYYNYSIVLPYCTNETLAAKMTIKKPEGMSKAKVYQYSTTSNQFEYIGLYENDEITIDCDYSATVASGHEGIMYYRLVGEGGYIAFLEMKDYSFKKESLNQTYTLDKDTSLIFTADVDFAKFESVAVDGQIISADNYTAKSGSTIVELKKDFLNRLSAGEHTITVNWVDGSASTKINVESHNVIPPTGDGAGIGLFFTLLILSGIGMIKVKRTFK
ncbi:MAG: hypothetical protein ACI4EN_04165 [Butyrivibrio sp.]